MGLETVRIRLNFSKVLIKQPVIFKMAAIFKVSPSILKADVEEEGWVLLDLTGTVEEIEHALKWLTAGVIVGVFGGSMIWAGRYLYPIVITAQQMSDCYKTKGYYCPPEDWN
mgnify:CR=1 FL=1